MSLNNICIILVEPLGSLNIGSVSRAMMNFGLSDLRLVNPKVSHLNDEARRMAVRSTVLLEKARIFPDLSQALADCHFSMATTRRLGKYRGNYLVPDAAARHLLPLAESGTVALVFGREDHGLSTSELDLCQRLICIPSHDDLRSLNLAQAVTVCLSQIFTEYKNSEEKEVSVRKLASSETLEGMYNHMCKTLVDVNYLDSQNPEHILRTFRAIFGRAELNEREVRVLHGLWSRMDWIEAERRKGLNTDSNT